MLRVSPKYVAVWFDWCCVLSKLMLSLSQDFQIICILLIFFSNIRDSSKKKKTHGFKFKLTYLGDKKKKKTTYQFVGEVP